jgi:hypothetical protein
MEQRELTVHIDLLDKTVRQLVKIAKSAEKWYERCDALTALTVRYIEDEEKNQLAIKALVHGYGDEINHVRNTSTKCLHYLTEHKYAETGREICSELSTQVAEAIKTETNPEAKKKALLFLTEETHLSMAKALKFGLSDKNSEVRSCAAFLLSGRTDWDMVEDLLGRLQDPKEDVWVRSYSAKALARYCHLSRDFTAAKQLVRAIMLLMMHIDSAAPDLPEHTDINILLTETGEALVMLGKNMDVYYR